MRFWIILAVVVTQSFAAFAEDTKTIAVVQIPVTLPKGTPAKLSPQDKADIKRIESYLGHIKTVVAQFSQVSPDGGISTGKFYLKRPGKFRMEYDPPIPVLVVTSNNNVVYYDKDLDQVTNIPLDSTLVGFLARDEILFDDTVIITRFERGLQSIRISLVQSKRPKDGSMTLEFSDAPLTLRNIITTDSSDQTTTVSLSNARFDEPLDGDLFVFKDPHLTGERHIQK